MNFDFQHIRATHYSYDIHGNVHTLIQDLPELASVGHRFKYVRYDYDLVSGNVKRVRYQEGESDAFYHRYAYDADNRLVMTETSQDERIWDRDAEYEYYLHGPLARVLIGEKMVQGVDYAYSLHGWLKGVNSVSLNANRDMGRDGTSTSSVGQPNRRYVARDAFGFALNYYYDANSEADYEAIAPGSNWNGGRLETQLTSGANQLYNGNINSMVTSVAPFMEGGPMATVYRYDQLNRIKGMKTYRNFNQSTNVWNSGGTSNFFATNYSYDANGNILSLNRNSGDGSKLGMDALTYHYKAGTNQLEYVDDAVTAGDHENDVDDQEEDNYVYDAIGNLVQDVAEGIETIEWNVYGKVRRIIISSTASDKPDLEFRYDAGGQRVVKIVKDGANEIDWKYQYYVRDAQGNVMATYDKKSVVSGDTSVYRKINEWLITNEGGTAFGEFVDGELKGGQFDGALVESIIEWSEFDNVMSPYDWDDLVGWNNGFVTGVFPYFEGVATSMEIEWVVNEMLTNYYSQIANLLATGCITLPKTHIENMLQLDQLNNELLWALLFQNSGGFDNMYMNLGGPFPSPNPSKISWLRSNVSDGDLADAILMWMMGDVSNAINSLAYSSSTGLLYDYLYQNFWVATEFASNCLAVMNDFWDGFSNQAMLRDIVMANYAQEYLLALAINGDVNLIKNVAESYSYLVAEAVRKLEGMSVEQYLALVKKHYGDGVMGDLLTALSGDLLFAQKFVLNEHHLYGSSRLGVKTHKRVLLRKEFSISGFEPSTGSGQGGEYIVDEVTDSLVYVKSEEYFYRVLAQKQYEMSNHLGNVLATVLDRRTGVFDEGADTLMYYVADVVSATLYYPFGSSMISYSNIEFAYSYGMNTQEKDDEIYGEGNSYSAEYWQYDARLGRRWNVDPVVKSHESPYAAFANNPISLVDIYGNDTSTINNNSGGYVGFDIVENPKQGDKYTINSGLYLYFDNVTGRVQTGYKYSETKVYHAGNDYAVAGWYSESDYEYYNRDWAGGQVLNSLSGLDAMLTGTREWNGWEVSSDGYLTGRPVIPIIGGSGSIELIGGFGALGKASKALKAAQAAKNLSKAGNYSVYSYIKNGALYIGKAKNGEVVRYGLKFVHTNQVNAFSGLSLTIPNNGIALGIEQAIMNLNGFGTPGKLSNIRAATKNEILIQEGIKHLNTHCPGWEKIFKLQ